MRDTQTGPSRSLPGLGHRFAGGRASRFSLLLPLCAVFFALAFFPVRVMASSSVLSYAESRDLLRWEKPEDRAEGHYLELVDPDAARCVAEPGDTLWGIARQYYGSGARFPKLLEDNPGRVRTPETLLPGTVLWLDGRRYLAAGMRDFISTASIPVTWDGSSRAWDWDPDGPACQIFQKLTCRNDFGADSPFRRWERFQSDVAACAETLCDGRVSQLSFVRYRVTGLCDLCSYQFVFDGGGRQYLIVAAFACTDDRESPAFAVYNGYGQKLALSCQNRQMETFAVCDLSRCREEDLEAVKGQTLYLTARNIDSLAYLEKTEDAIGAEDWNYPQLHNPFAQAMASLLDEPPAHSVYHPLGRTLRFQDAALEALVREALADLWQLTETERRAFLARPLTAGDLSGIRSLSLREDGAEQKISLLLNAQNRERHPARYVESRASVSAQASLTTLADLALFPHLVDLSLYLSGSELSDFSPLGALRGLRGLSIRLERPVHPPAQTDFAFLGKLKALRLLYLYPAESLSQIGDLSVLTGCPHLTYLKLETEQLTRYDFLGDLPELYYVCLKGGAEVPPVLSDPALLPHARFLQYNGEWLRFDVGG